MYDLMAPSTKFLGFSRRKKFSILAVPSDAFVVLNLSDLWISVIGGIVFISTPSAQSVVFVVLVSRFGFGANPLNHGAYSIL